MVGTRAWTSADVAASLRMPTDADHKYSRGVVGVRTGSDRYPGAAVLGVEAAWRTGIGMVRYVGPEAAAAAVLARRPETVTGDGRVQAWLIGSGTDAAERARAETGALRHLLAGDVPVVADAGALDLVAGATAPVVVTPHEREHATLRAALGLDEPVDADRVTAALDTAAALGGVVVLKGAETIVAAPDGTAVRVRAGTPWLATAGTGDVLGGVIAALVAGRAARGDVDPTGLAASAASGAWLHGQAGALASRDLGGGPVTALDVAAALPRAVGAVLSGRF
ncbi:ADP-dependent NAD(P)H-hydrate dehydratase [Microbacterium jiangjiandongii]|uniref:ADP-dependent NAD(P)H-hydrate dehydratase n=1 Tax=Microbacterium jiangjiandongii TaxID=3049071 RepID=UPI00214BBD11|nr:ADP/ATP-dependent (S)-NAD(P)H-hydrate dehydratase [Microbacterium sp. zg.Y843]MCR2816112.1 NAD(P)H-hydrate dehydratase [Microbacterium sp. zg.Y843]